MADSTEKTQPQKRVESDTGVVVSIGGDKTCTVEISWQVAHPLYGKIMKRNTKMAVHDPSNEAGLGDTVTIVPCRPISKRKRWRLAGVVSKAKMVK